MKEDFANYLLLKTKNDYNLIAKDFASKRSFKAPEVMKELIFRYLKPNKNEKLLDWGCGHGRYYEILKDFDYYGLDVSENLIEIAKNKYPEAKFFVLPSFLQLPYEDNFFNHLICIDTLHHIPSKKYRELFIKEAYRVLKDNGFFILTVWNLNFFHLLRAKKLERVWLIIKAFFKKIFGLSPLDLKDVLIPWANQCDRYVHRFSKKELEKLVKNAGFQIVESGVLKRSDTGEKDFFVVAQKIKLQQ